MSERNGPFGLRLPAELMIWLRDDAFRHNRSTTSQTLFVLQNSLSVCFTKTAVQAFLAKHPTNNNNESFGLRIADDLKTQLRELSQQHGISLNMEIVMRLVHSYEQHYQQPAAVKIKQNKSLTMPAKEPPLSDPEQKLLYLFRKLNTGNKNIIMELLHNLAGND